MGVRQRGIRVCKGPLAVLPLMVQCTNLAETSQANVFDALNPGP